MLPSAGAVRRMRPVEKKPGQLMDILRDRVSPREDGSFGKGEPALCVLILAAFLQKSRGVHDAFLDRLQRAPQHSKGTKENRP